MRRRHVRVSKGPYLSTLVSSHSMMRNQRYDASEVGPRVTDALSILACFKSVDSGYEGFWNTSSDRILCGARQLGLLLSFYILHLSWHRNTLPTVNLFSALSCCRLPAKFHIDSVPEMVREMPRESKCESMSSYCVLSPSTFFIAKHWSSNILSAFSRLIAGCKYAWLSEF